MFEKPTLKDLDKSAETQANYYCLLLKQVNLNQDIKSVEELIKWME